MQRVAISLLLSLTLLWGLVGCGQPNGPATPAASSTQATAPPAAEPKATAPASSKQQPAAPAPVPKELKPIHIGFIAISASWLPVWLADEAGLFEKYGLKPEFHYIVGRDLMNALLAGRVDFSSNGEADVLPAIAAGGDPMMVAEVVSRGLLELVGKKGVTKLEDLKGKQVFTGNRGGFQYVGTQMLLQKAGFTLGKDVTMLPISGGNPELVAALESGRADAVGLIPPLSRQLFGRGYPKVSSLADLNIAIPVSSLATTRTFAKKNPEVVEQALRAYQEGLKLMKSDRELALKVLMKWTKVDRPVAEETLDAYMPAYASDLPFKSLAATREAIQYYTEFNTKVATVDPKLAFDNSYLEKICGCKAPQ